MCLTLTNCIDKYGHCPAAGGRSGWTNTTHHIGYLAPGDLWHPDQEPLALPHTVAEVHHIGDMTTLVDQYGDQFVYPAGSLLPTAVPDPPHWAPSAFHR